MPNPAQQVFSSEFDRIFFRLPLKVRHEIEGRIDFLGLHLRDFRHQRPQGVDAFKLRVGGYRIIYLFDVSLNVIKLITRAPARGLPRYLNGRRRVPLMDRQPRSTIKPRSPTSPLSSSFHPRLSHTPSPRS